MGWTFEVIELTTVQCPPENRSNGEHRDQRERNEQVEDVHL